MVLCAGKLYLDALEEEKVFQFRDMQCVTTGRAPRSSSEMVGLEEVLAASLKGRPCIFESLGNERCAPPHLLQVHSHFIGPVNAFENYPCT